MKQSMTGPQEPISLAPLLPEELWRSHTLVHDPAHLRTRYIARHSGPRTDLRYLAHPFWEFSVVMSGEGTLEMRTGSIRLGTHTTLLIPPDLEHREASASMDTIWIGFEGRLMSRTPRKAAFQLRDSAPARAAEELWLFAERRHGEIGFEIDGGLLRFIGHFFRVLSEGAGAVQNDPIDRALVLMHERCAESIDFADLSMTLGISEGYFYRLFKRRTGMTPSHYLTHIRIERACRWLRLTHSGVAEIAAKVGYPDAFYFSRVFKKLKGVAPVKYRTG